jgi:TolB-like protein/Tfp pilus assembly protein PilF
MGTDLRAIYRFDRFTLHLVRGALLSADGSELPLRPKSFAMLHHLVAHAERLVDRDELMQVVWPAVFVTDDSIAQCVKEIRRALGDQSQRLLRTVPRRGYLLAVPALRVAAAERGAEEAMPEPARALPAPPTNRQMVVVLPFENIGHDPEQGYLADGLTADLVTDLTRFQDLHVVSPQRHGYGPSAAAMGASSPGWALPPEARYVLGGSVRRAGGRIRVTVRLGDARTGVSIWAERFDRSLGELFAVQEELAELLPASLVSQIERERMRAARRHPPSSLDAYDLCLRGRELHARATEADTLAAREMFARAIALDPEYASAYAGMAWTVQRGFTHLWGEPRGPAAAALAEELARRSVEIEPDSPLCLARLAFVLLLRGAWEEALETGRAAVRANPCAPEPRHGYGDVLVHAGDPGEAEREIRLAFSLEPFRQPVLRAPLGRALLLAGRPEEALGELRRCAASLPDYGPCYQTMAVAAAELGQMEEAHDAAQALLRLRPGFTVRAVGETWFFRDPAVAARFRKGLRAAGMPEG